MMKTAHALVVCCTWLGFGTGAAVAQTQRGVMAPTVRLNADPAPGTVWRVGQEVELRIAARYEAAPAGSSLYVLLLALADGQAILGKAKGNAASASFHYCGAFSDRPGNPFNIVQGNYPISATLAQETLLKSIAVGPEQMDLVAKQDSLERLKGNLIEFTFGFVASLGDGGSGTRDGVVRFRLPSLEQFYNGLMVVPFVLSYEEETRCVTVDSKRIDILKYEVIPDRKREVKPSERPTGRVRIVSVEPEGTRLRLGTENVLRLTVEYEDVPPESEIYVWLAPGRADTIVTSERMLFHVPGGFAFTACNLVPEQGSFRIPQADRPLYAGDFPYLTTVELAHIESLPEGGSGRVTRVIRFTPPMLALRYRNVMINPMVAFQRTEENTCARREPSVMEGVRVPMEGR